MKYKIQTLNNISDKGLSRLPEERYLVSDDVENPDALLVRSADLHSIKIPESVVAIGRAGAGTNNIPIQTMSKRGIAVFNTPGANANAVKELVIAGMLIAARNIVHAVRFASKLDAQDADLNKKVESSKKQFVGFELPGKTLGVIGLGAIGLQVANAGVALGMKVVGYDPGISVKHAWQLSSEVRQATTLDELFRKSDIITVHVPLMDGTRGLVNAEAIEKMPDGVVLLNFARGGIMDEDAVLAGIDEGKVSCYVSDFPSPAALQHPKVAALPHLGASTAEAEENCAKMAADELKTFLEEGNVQNSVNLPNTQLPRSEGTSRIAIINDNVPHMVSQISQRLGDLGFNIADLINKSKSQLAYTLVDVNGPVTEDVVAQLRTVPGVLSARLVYTD